MGERDRARARFVRELAQRRVARVAGGCLQTASSCAQDAYATLRVVDPAFGGGSRAERWPRIRGVLQAMMHVEGDGTATALEQRSGGGVQQHHRIAAAGQRDRDRIAACGERRRPLRDGALDRRDRVSPG